VPKKSEKIKLNSILFIYEVFGDSALIFFIPDGNTLDKTVRIAMRTARNTFSNGDELTTEQELAHDVLNAAMTDDENAKGLDHIHMPFAGLLLPFKVTDQKSLQSSAKLNYVRCGTYA